MARPGFVHEVDERTPPLVLASGTGLVRLPFPLGTRVVYPTDPLPGLDVDRAVEQALADPVDGPPLRERLHPGMRLTITFSGVAEPLPRMRPPDVRGRIVEKVLAAAAQAGVDDVALVAATGLSRRLTLAEIEQIVGERAFRSFVPGPDASAELSSHDAEDRAQLTRVGAVDTADGLVAVELNARVAASDLVVHIASPTGAGAGWAGFADAVASATTHAARTALGGELDDAALASVVREMPVMVVEAALNSDALPAALSPLLRREWEWRLRDKVQLDALRRALDVMPAGAAQQLYDRAGADYGVLAVTAGDPDAVKARTDRVLARQHVVEVSGRCDVVALGVGPYSPSSVGSPLNPLAAAAAAAQTLARHTGTPLLREGGAVVVFHPATPIGAGRQHTSTADFLTDVLADTLDPVEIRQRYQERWASESWYRHLYRTANAYHALQPFQLWNALEPLRAADDVVWVGADRASVGRLGFRAATTLADALEIVAGAVGRTPTVGVLHSTPSPVVSVT